jgi:hypothetical protein
MPDATSVLSLLNSADGGSTPQWPERAPARFAQRVSGNLAEIPTKSGDMAANSTCVPNEPNAPILPAALAAGSLFGTIMGSTMPA